MDLIPDFNTLVVFVVRSYPSVWTDLVTFNYTVYSCIRIYHGPPFDHPSIEESKREPRTDGVSSNR